MNADVTTVATAPGRKGAPSAVLGFAAPIEAGKTTVSIAVARRLGAPRVSFGDYLRQVARERGLEVTRETLQDLGEGLVRRDVRAFCEGVLGQQPWRPDTPLVIDGVRHAEVLDALREILSPAAGYLIYIKIDPRTQAARLRDDVLRHEKSLAELERHSTEAQVRTVLPDRASLVLDGTRPAEELTQAVIEFLAGREAGGAEATWDEKNDRRIELAERKSVGELSGAELSEFDRLQTEYFDYLDAKHPRVSPDPDRLDAIEARLKAGEKSGGGD